ASISVRGSATLQNTSYLVATTTDGDGFFALDVMDGSWLVSVENQTVNALGLQSLAPRSITVAGADQEITFAAERIVGDGRIPILTASRLSDGTLQLNVASQTALPYRIDASSNLLDWTPVFTNTTVTGSFTFTNRLSAAARSQFFRAVLVE